MTRGFVTIAAGKEHYFKLAMNLLRSYRMHTNNPLPFAVLCDKENEYTQEFDKAVVMRDVKCSFLDKLKLYDYMPYDEVIFIDADALAYADLNIWWDVFENATDFSGFGFVWDLKSGRGWFNPENIGEFTGKVKYVPALQGGVYYLRKTPTCEAVFRTAQHIIDHYFDYEFAGFKNEPADEPALALSMAVHNCKSLRNMNEQHCAHVCNMPRMNHLNADITVPKCVFEENNEEWQGELIHWGSARTRYAYYRFESEKVSRAYNRTDTSIGYMLKYKSRLRYYLLILNDVKYFPERLKKRLKRKGILR